MDYGILVIDHRQLFLTRTSLRLCSDMLVARAWIDNGRMRSAIKLLRPYAEDGVGEAEYLLAGVGSPREPREEFDARHFKQLESAAMKVYPPALYSLGAYYDVGDVIAQDKARAAAFFRKAAMAGHAHSQWIHGEDLLHGHNGIAADPEKGKSFLIASANAKFVPALEAVAKYFDAGTFGFLQSQAEAHRYRSMLDDGDVIEM